MNEEETNHTRQKSFEKITKYSKFYKLHLFMYLLMSLIYVLFSHDIKNDAQLKILLHLNSPPLASSLQWNIFTYH